LEKIKIVNLGPQLVIGLRKRGHYREIAEMFARLYKYASEKGAEFSGMPAFICHESPEEAREADKAGNAEIEVVTPIKERIKCNNEMDCYTIPGGKMAKIVHKGPYEECETTYNELFTWIKENNKRIIGPIREVYLNDPKEVETEEILTEIYVPIE
jgi:AraC family transcriptional regulator